MFPSRIPQVWGERDSEAAPGVLLPPLRRVPVSTHLRRSTNRRPAKAGKKFDLPWVPETDGPVRRAIRRLLRRESTVDRL